MDTLRTSDRARRNRRHHAGALAVLAAIIGLTSPLLDSTSAAASRRPRSPGGLRGPRLIGLLGPPDPQHARQARGSRTESERSFTHYLLALSYAPDFCAQPRGFKDPRQCGRGRRVGFVVHGLWPQGPAGRGPEYCKATRTVPDEVVARALGYLPTESLIQHEWRAHGSCTGLTPADYFAATRKARDAVQIPDLLQPSVETELRPAEILTALASANPHIPRDSFRISCYPDKTLQEVRVCLTRDELQPRACGRSAGYCAGPLVRLRPVR
jgi:ribonuclease T2